MRVGMQLPHFRPSTPETMGSWFKDTAQAAEDGGFYSVWVMDHFFQLGGWLGEAEEPMVEGYSALNFMAGVTQRIRLGLLVGGVIYRHPSVVIKTVTTLDVLSGGRAYFGIGAAWYQHETESLGMTFPPTKTRFEQLEDILRLAHHMWDGNKEPFEGKQVQVPYPFLNPRPLSRPHPPIMIGGGGEKKTLRYVARYGNACNLFARLSNEELTHKLNVLHQHCEDVGRPYDEIEKTALQNVKPDEMTMDEVLARFEELGALGFDHIIFNVVGEYTPDLIGRIGETVVAELAAA